MPKGRVNRSLLVLLTLSAATNVVFWRALSATPENSPPAASANVAVAATNQLDADAAAKLAFLRSLEDEHLRQARAVADDYWSHDADYQASYSQALADGLQAMRDELVGRFGWSAQDDPLFRALFRPLDPMYWFLSSDQQLAIRNLKLERDLALQSAVRSAGIPGAGSQPGAMPVSDAATVAIMQKYQADLATILDDDARLEFELRDSPVAAQLRASGVELTEAEFRETYALLSELQAGQGEVAAILAVRERLREVLGDSRFAALWAARDPVFAQVEQIARRHSLPDAKARAVYGVMNEFQDRRMRIAQAAAINPDFAARDSLALADEERAAIARVVGEEIADEIVRGRAMQSLRLFGSAGPPQQASAIPRN